VSKKTETNREKALRGKVVVVTENRLKEMKVQAVLFEGITANPVYHWHWSAVLNELEWRRKFMDSQFDAGTSGEGKQ
jgi:hypothetical protein